MTPETDTDTELAARAEVAEEPTRAPVDLERALEAVLIVADEPLPLVSLATALGSPIAAVRQSVERLVADYDGTDGGPVRGFELREVGGGWRIYVRPAYDEVVKEFVLTQNPTRLSQ